MTNDISWLELQKKNQQQLDSMARSKKIRMLRLDHRNCKQFRIHSVIVKKIMKSIMDGLINNTKPEIVPANLIEHLEEISQDYRYVPNGILFNFEINRLNFTFNGALKGSNRYKTMMIACFFVIIKVLLGEILFKISEIPNGASSDTIYRNVKNISTILTLAVIDYVKRDAQLVPEIRLKPRPNTLFFNAPNDLKDENYDEPPKKKTDDLTSIVNGLYSKDEMPYFGNKPLYDEIKALIGGWAEKMEPIISALHAEKVKLHKEHKD